MSCAGNCFSFASSSASRRFSIVRFVASASVFSKSLNLSMFAWMILRIENPMGQTALNYTTAGSSSLSAFERSFVIRSGRIVICTLRVCRPRLSMDYVKKTHKAQSEQKLPTSSHLKDSTDLSWIKANTCRTFRLVTSEGGEPFDTFSNFMME